MTAAKEKSQAFFFFFFKNLYKFKEILAGERAVSRPWKYTMKIFRITSQYLRVISVDKGLFIGSKIQYFTCETMNSEITVYQQSIKDVSVL